MVRVKICGITRAEDARIAVRLGADALGFVFADSPRKTPGADVRLISEGLGPFVTRVGVFVNPALETALDAAARCGLDALQLHGEESSDLCARLARYKIIKTFRMGREFSPDTVNRYPIDACLLETDDALRGGSGKTWDWKKFPVKKIKGPYIVSGGLTPDNVAEAVRILRPYAVDVSSGVEKRPGVKDPELMERFIHAAKTA